MGLDEQGFLWLSDPWVAATAIAVAVGLLLWCHLRIAGDDFERPAAAPAHVEITPPARRPRSASGGARQSCRLAGERERRDVRRPRVA